MTLEFCTHRCGGRELEVDHALVVGLQCTQRKGRNIPLDLIHQPGTLPTARAPVLRGVSVGSVAWFLNSIFSATALTMS